MASIHVLWKVCLLITPPIKSAQMEIGGTSTWIPSFCGSALESTGTGCTGGIWRSILTHCPLLIHRGTHWHQCVRHRVRPVVTIWLAHIRVRCKVVSMWHQCSVGRSFIHVLWPRAHKLCAASYMEMPFWRFDPNTNIAPCYQVAHKNMLTCPKIWLEGFWWYFIT